MTDQAQMTVREKMVAYRLVHNLSLKDMSDICNVSTHLLEILEEGGTTTPKLVPQIAEAYELSEIEGEELMPEFLRPHGNNYDPYRYVDLKDIPEEMVNNEKVLKSLYDNIKEERL